MGLFVWNATAPGINVIYAGSLANAVVTSAKTVVASGDPWKGGLMNICVPKNPLSCSRCPFARPHVLSLSCRRGHCRGCPPCSPYSSPRRKNAWGSRGVFLPGVMLGDPDYAKKVAALKAARELCADVVRGMAH